MLVGRNEQGEQVCATLAAHATPSGRPPVHWAPGGSSLLSVAEDYWLYWHDLSQASPQEAVLVNQGLAATQPSLSGDSKAIVLRDTTVPSGNLMLSSVADGTPSAPVAVSSGGTDHYAWGPDGDVLLWATASGDVYEADVVEGQPTDITLVSENTPSVYALSMSPDKNGILAGDGFNGPTESYHVFRRSEDGWDPTAIATEGEIDIVGGKGETLRIWSADSTGLVFLGPATEGPGIALHYVDLTAEPLQDQVLETRPLDFGWLDAETIWRATSSTYSLVPVGGENALEPLRLHDLVVGRSPAGGEFVYLGKDERGTDAFILAEVTPAGLGDSLVLGFGGNCTWSRDSSFFAYEDESGDQDRWMFRHGGAEFAALEQYLEAGERLRGLDVGQITDVEIVPISVDKYGSPERGLRARSGGAPGRSSKI